MLVYLAGTIILITFAIVPFFAANFFMRALLFTGALSLSFAGGSRFFLSSIGGINADALKLLAVFMGGTVILLAANKRPINLLMNFKFHLFFICYATVSLIWCEDVIYGLRMIAKLIAPLLLLLMFQISLSSQDSISKTEKWIFGGGILIIVLSLVASALGLSTGKAHPIPRFTLPYINANPFSFYMLTLSLFSLCSFYYERRKYYLFIFLLFSIFCILPLTRITIAAYFVSLAMFFFFVSRKKMNAVLIPVLLFFISFYIFTTVDILKKRSFFRPDEVTFLSVLENPVKFLDQIDTSGRSNLWSKSLDRFFWNNPVIGTGIGSTQHYFYTGKHKNRIGIMHSDYIRLLCELGVIGCALFIVVFLLYIRRMYILWRKAQSRFTKKYALTAILGLTSYIIVSLTDNAIECVSYFIMYIFAFMAFAFQCYEQESRDEDSTI